MSYLPCIALSGAPCTGKTTALQGLAQEFGDEVLVVPEIASFVFAARLYPPTDKLANHNFVTAISQMRIALEDLAQLQRARTPSLKAIIVDRAVHDAAAYLDEGIGELAAVLGTSPDALHNRYDHVLFFSLPPERVLMRYWPSNSSRIDSIAQAKMLDEKTFATWDGHHAVTVMPPTDVWAERYGKVADSVRAIIQASLPGR